MDIEVEERIKKEIIKAKRNKEINLYYSGDLLISKFLPNISRCIYLKSLSLTHCGLTDFTNLLKLKNLSHLSLGANKITFIPHNIHSLFKLYHLSLLHNKIKIVPKNILKLDNLKILELNHNPIIKIPQFSKMKSLEHIFIRKTHLCKLPYTIYKYILDLNEFRFKNTYYNQFIRFYNKHKCLTILKTIIYIQQLYKCYLFLIEFYSHY